MANILSTWTPFSSSCKAVLVLMNSLSFCLPGNFYILVHFLKLVWPDILFLVDSFFLLAFWMFRPTPFYPVMFLLIYLLIIIWKCLCMWHFLLTFLFSLAASSVLCLWLLIVRLWYILAFGLFEFILLQFSSVQSLSHVRLFATPWTAARQASLSITNSQSPPKPTSIESVMLSNHLILCHHLLLLPSIFPNIRVFSNESSSSHQVARILEF